VVLGGSGARRERISGALVTAGASPIRSRANKPKRRCRSTGRLSLAGLKQALKAQPVTAATIRPSSNANGSGDGRRASGAAKGIPTILRCCATSWCGDDDRARCDRPGRAALRAGNTIVRALSEAGIFALWNHSAAVDRVAAAYPDVLMTLLPLLRRRW